MRKLFALVLGFIVASAIVAAQLHTGGTERKTSDLIVVTSDVRIGTHMLEAGEYRLVCDTKKIRFTRVKNNRLALEAECKGKELAAPAEATTMYTKVGQDGQRYVVKVLLRGSHVEHVFE